jgi:universal stress protein A
MHADKILFATDFSSTSETALEYATSLARDTGAMLLIVHVQEPPVVYAEFGLNHITADPSVGPLLRMLHQVVPSDPRVGYTQRLLTGSPAEEIVRVAEAEQVDMVVIGTHGRTGLSRLLMGSVAENVVRHAACPVLTVKPTALAIDRDALLDEARQADSAELRAVT